MSHNTIAAGRTAQRTIIFTTALPRHWPETATKKMIVQRLVFDYRLNEAPHLSDIDKDKLKCRIPQLLVALGPFHSICMWTLPSPTSHFLRGGGRPVIADFGLFCKVLSCSVYQGYIQTIKHAHIYTRMQISTMRSRIGAPRPTQPVSVTLNLAVANCHRISYLICVPPSEFQIPGSG